MYMLTAAIGPAFDCNDIAIAGDGKSIWNVWFTLTTSEEFRQGKVRFLTIRNANGNEIAPEKGILMLHKEE